MPVTEDVEELKSSIPGLDYFIIHPDNGWYRVWTQLTVIWAIYISFMLSMPFSHKLTEMDIILREKSAQIMFLMDIAIHFFNPYYDVETCQMIKWPSFTAMRYLKSNFIFDLFGCFIAEIIYKDIERRELVNCLLWIRLYQVRKVNRFFKMMENDVDINWIFKFIGVALYCFHTTACIFYYLATTLPPCGEGYTWIGCLTLGDYNYMDFRCLGFWKRCITSLYFTIVTIANACSNLVLSY